MPKTVIITGASRGTEKYTAKLFAIKGYNVLINYPVEIYRMAE